MFVRVHLGTRNRESDPTGINNIGYLLDGQVPVRFGPGWGKGGHVRDSLCYALF